MTVLFKDDILAEYYEGSYSGKQPYSEIILKGFRKVINRMIAAENLNELRKIGGLSIEYFSGEWKSRINDQYRIHFTIEENDTIIINKISKHYE